MSYGVLRSYQNEFNITVYKVASSGLSYKAHIFDQSRMEWRLKDYHGSSCRYQWYLCDSLEVAKAKAIVQAYGSYKYFKFNPIQVYPELFI